ncbi:MAG: protein translocase subunit SecF [Roseburia sp.]|nr:protein translocase subunit SecF [Roseburia sp.]
MKKLENLLEKDFHIVEKRKVIFAVPLAIIFVAAILMIIFRFTLGSALNLGTDFTGGYSIDIMLGDKLTDSNYRSYCDRVENILESVTSDDGKTYSIRVDNMQRQGSGDNSTIHVKYFAVRGASESEMIDDVNPAIQKALEERILMIIPDVSVDGNTIYITYGEVLSDPMFNDRKAAFIELMPSLNSDHSAGITLADDGIVLNAENKKQIIISCTAFTNSDDATDAIASGMRIDDKYSGRVTQGDLVGATVSTELLFNAILAVSLALVFMLCYIGLRFQLSSGLACIIALFHDIIIMFSFMAICHIEINSTFIAALITILGYSINNSIIIFDRVRENVKSIFSKNMTPEQIANKSIKETLLRSINTTITTLIMILMVAILGVSDIKIFAFPIIIGLLAGTFSSICIAPSFWALFQRVGKNRNNFALPPKDKKDGKKGEKNEKVEKAEKEPKEQGA